MCNVRTAWYPVLPPVRIVHVLYRQAMGMEYRVDDPSDPAKMRYQVKPLENRSLYVPTR